jgi:hypothetical protein
MGRGLGQRQRKILDRLREADDDLPLWKLADNPDEPNEMAKARSAVRGLERRGLVDTWQDHDPRRRVEIRRVQLVGWPPVYALAPAIPRAWFGMWVELRTTPKTSPTSRRR